MNDHNSVNTASTSSVIEHSRYAEVFSMLDTTQNNPFSESFVRGPMNPEAAPSQVAS